MSRIDKYTVIVSLVGIVAIAAIATLLGMSLVSLDSSNIMAQESIRQVQWVQVNPPPGVEGPCWGFYEDMIGVGESLAGVWCK